MTVFSAWKPQYAARWNHEPLCLPHRLHTHPAFAPEALATLIERCPPGDRSLVLVQRDAAVPRRREGEFGAASGAEVLEAIAAHRFWLNLREVHRHDAACAAVLQTAYAEIASEVPGFAAGALKMGILISSPSAWVDYHCDLPGQLLWQVRGHKRVWVYPPKAPWLLPAWLEDIAYTGSEFRLRYEPGFDRAACVFDLAPGQMLAWPLNSPHRVENADDLNVSITTEHWTAANRRSQQVHLANAVLRHRLGVQRRGQALAGPGYWARAALQALWRRNPWARSTQRAARSIDFRLAPAAPGGYVDLAAPS